MTAPPPPVREYDVAARTTDVFGRVLCSARTHHFVVDGPVQNGCPGEEITPPELFLSSVAACGVELVQVIARDSNVAIGTPNCLRTFRYSPAISTARSIVPTALAAAATVP